MNTHVTPSKAKGVGKRGNPKPGANMPANNVGMATPKMGTTHGSSIVASSTGKSAGKASTISSQKAKLPTSNHINTSFNMGNTKHGVGEVPAYLKSKQK